MKRRHQSNIEALLEQSYRGQSKMERAEGELYQKARRIEKIVVWK